MMMLQTSEMNRDRKKQPKPGTLEQFCLYADNEQKNMPAPKYGAAALALIERGMFPIWALFVYEDLKKNASKSSAPPVLAYVCDDAVILAPEVTNDGLRGMLIAQRSASGMARTLQNELGDSIRIIMPQIKSTVFADEEAIFDILSVASGAR